MIEYSAKKFIQEALMFRLITIFICLSMLLAEVSSSYAVENPMDAVVLQSFEPIVDKIAAFFKRHPKLLTKNSAPDNPSQMAFSITHFQMERISFDIVTTNSIIAPYKAVIDIDTQVADNKPCGNQAFVKTDKEGWSNVEDAVKNANNASCFLIRTPQVGVVRHKFIFQYFAKTGKWSLNEIVYQDGTINGRFMALLGVPSPWFPVMNEPQAVNYNRDWIQLLKSL